MGESDLAGRFGDWLFFAALDATAITIALVIALVGNVVGPSLIQQRSWKRADAIADRAADSADQANQDALDAKRATREVARLLAQSNHQQTAANIQVAEQLDRIHAYVNSDMTAAMDATKTALEGQLALLLASDRSATPAMLATIEQVQAKIAELTQTLTLRAQAAAEVEAANAKSKAAVVAVESMVDAQQAVEDDAPLTNLPTEET